MGTRRPEWNHWAVIVLAGMLIESAVAQGEDDNVLAAIEVARNGASLIVPIESQGVVYNYVVGTGTSTMMVESKLAANWTPHRFVNSGTANGIVKLPAYRRPEEVFLAGFTLRRNAEVGAASFYDISETTGIKIDGIVGMNDLKQFIIQIDFDRGQLRFLESVPDDCGDKFRLSFERGIPDVQWTVGDNQITACVATDQEVDVSLNRIAFDLLLERNRIDSTGTIPSTTAGGERKCQSGTLRELNLGKFQHTNLEVQCMAVNGLGLGFLSRYLVTFDFPRQAMYLKPGRDFNRPRNRDYLGLIIIRRDNKVVVESVAKDNPAELAGIRPGDVLPQVNGKETTGELLFDLRQRLCTHAGTSVKLRIERDGQSRDVTVKLRRRID